MAVKIEKGGWVVIFTLGLGLVGYSLNKYGILDKLIPSAKVRESTEIGKIDLPTATTTEFLMYASPHHLFNWLLLGRQNV